MLEPIFLIGCARSGTTIIGKFFEKNSQCYYLDEYDIWEEYASLANQSPKVKIRILLWKSLRKIIPSNLFVRKLHYFITKPFSRSSGEGHRLTEKDISEKIKNQVDIILHTVVKDKRLVMKSTQNSLRIPFIKKLFPSAKFVHILRDGRDVTCSLLKGNEGEYWPHVKPPEWKKHIKSDPIERCAWIWNSVISIINNDIANIPKEDYIELKYENFIKNPEEVMKKIFEHFKIPFESSQIELCNKVSNKMDKKFLTGTHSDDWSSFDHKNRVGRYKENLDKKQLYKVEEILGENNKKIGYL